MSTAIDTIADFIAAMPWEERKAFAKSTKHAPYLAELARCEEGTQLEVASNVATDSNTLGFLSAAESHYVRFEVADNKNAPLDVLVELINDVDGTVRQGAVDTLRIAILALSNAAKNQDETTEIRELATRNLGMASYALRDLSRDADQKIAEVAVDRVRAGAAPIFESWVAASEAVSKIEAEIDAAYEEGGRGAVNDVEQDGSTVTIHTVDGQRVVEIEPGQFTIELEQGYQGDWLVSLELKAPARG